jgi:hypothetical protein
MTRMKKIDEELARMFGEPLMRLAEFTDPLAMDLSAALMDHVHDGADALLVMRGNPEEQQLYVQDLPHKVRLVLCMWLMDTGLASKLVRATLARAS